MNFVQVITYPPLVPCTGDEGTPSPHHLAMNASTRRKMPLPGETLYRDLDVKDATSDHT